MDADFWQQRWDNDQIGFHQEKINSRLIKLWPQLGVAAGATVFIPLCGKTTDVLWLHQQGHTVVGVELSEKAVVAFFTENNLSFEQSSDGAVNVFSGTGSASGVRLLQGDLFALAPEQLGGATAFYDRAALVALPETMRADYVSSLHKLLPSGAVGMLLSMNYDPSEMQGPPFPVSDTEVRELLGAGFNLEQLAFVEGPQFRGDLARRGLSSIEERVYKLERRAN